MISVIFSSACSPLKLTPFCFLPGWVLWNRVMTVKDSLLPALRHIMKKSAKTFLLFLLVWMLLFFLVFSYFNESQVNQSHRTTSFLNSESQHSTHVQRSSRAIMASRNARWDLFAERRGPFQRRQVYQPRRTRKEFHFRDFGKRQPEIKPPESDFSWSVVRGLWKGKVSYKLLSQRLQEAVKDHVHSNKHKVHYRGQRKANKGREEILCQMKEQAQLKTLDGSEQPFARLGFQQLVPPRLHRAYRTCAVVTSAGAILNSSLGLEIGELGRDNMHIWLHTTCHRFENL